MHPEPLIWCEPSPDSSGSMPLVKYFDNPVYTVGAP